MSRRWAHVLTDRDILVASWRQHPVVLAPSVAAAAGAGVAGLWVPAGAPSTFVWTVTAVLTIRCAWKATQWAVDWVVVTDQQVQRIFGVLVPRNEITRLAHTTGLSWRRSIGGRIFGYGEAILLPAGPHDAMHLRYVPDPEKHHLLLRRLLATGIEPL